MRVADLLIVHGNSGADRFVLSPENPSTASARYQDLRVNRAGAYDVNLTNSVRAEGDLLVIVAGDGNDVIDASANPCVPDRYR